MINLVNVYHHDESCKILYDLLSERTPDQSISHQKMPTWEEHVAFFNSIPYKNWNLIFSIDPDRTDCIGACYLTKQQEIGIFIFKAHQRKGYGRKAVELMMNMHTGPFFANINPLNIASMKMFGGLGFKHIQDTLKYG